MARQGIDRDNTEQSSVTPNQTTARNIVKARRRFNDNESEPELKGKFTLIQSFGGLDLKAPLAKPTFNFALVNSA